ncbi:hypothetical protein T4D_12277 [Trichinella pseudospiralis]|uniref:Uncharacterized protein n=1 Tax=Trichinella pseudospiralis TaxID=6337 RepID=A0A0V1FI63_TRIPS|nr:hypothetical protein T4D_12277 [Trichinella pseudospiralis]
MTFMLYLTVERLQIHSVTAFSCALISTTIIIFIIIDNNPITVRVKFRFVKLCIIGCLMILYNA